MASLEPFPYGSPPWRRSHRAVSPDGVVTAEVADAREIGMSDPTRGVLRTSTGVVLGDANPAFLFSDDGRWLAAPVWSWRWFRRPLQRLAVIDLRDGTVHVSKRRFPLLDPLRFDGGVLVAHVGVGGDERVTVRIPRDLDVDFSPLPGR